MVVLRPAGTATAATSAAGEKPATEVAA
jgi:hypothetical protein